MPIRLEKLASKLGFTESEMRKHVLELGFEANDEIEDDIAELITDELSGKAEKAVVDVYTELSEVEMDREIIKQQRKQKAGKAPKRSEDRSKKTSRSEASIPVEGADVEIPDQISVKELAEKSGLSAARLIGELMKNGILANINQIIDYDTAVIITANLGINLRKKRAEFQTQDFFQGNLNKLLEEEDLNLLIKRPPVVSVMGHVDHGKTTLLDSIREANVVASESGGITQHIGAYQVEKNGQKITFLDTPGHEAFTAMRARGAQATDIAILVVAADDGVMPQTIEAIHHAQDAKIPIIVAINKIDKPGANLDRLKAELAEQGLQPEEWGGDTMMIPVSALKKQGIDQLLEGVLLLAEMKDLKANANRPGVGTVIESHLDPSIGPVATILINTGSLKIGDNIVIGKAFGKVKVMKDSSGKKIQNLGPSDTAQIAGLNETVDSGQLLQVVKDERSARHHAEQINQLTEESKLIQGGMSMQEILTRIKEGSLKLLKIIIKADTKGSLEAIKQALDKVKSDQVAIKIILSGVGDITESDVMMAAASRGAMVIGFHTLANPQVRKLAEHMNVEVVSYEVIYELIDDLKKILSGLLEPEILTVELGSAKVLKVFYTGRGEMVVGVKITDGKLEKKANLRVLRNSELIGEGKLAALKLVNEDMQELDKGAECGLRYAGKLLLEEGDILQAWKQEKKMRTL